MRRTALAFASSLALVCLAGGTASAAEAAMFRGNPQLTGVYDTKPVYGVSGVRFTFKTGGPIRSAPAVVGGSIYFGSGDGNFYALDSATGKERWRLATGGEVHSSPTVIGGGVYFASRDGNFYAASTRDGRVMWKHTFGANLTEQNYWDFYPSSATPFGGTLYVGSGDGRLYALDSRSGKTLWSHDVGSRVRATPAVTDDVVVFGAMNGKVYAVGRKDGALRWTFATEGASHKFEDKENDTTSIYASPSISDGVVTVGGRDGNLYAIDLATGKQNWEITHDGGSWILSTAVENGTVYSGSGSAYFAQSADLKTGKENWRFPTGSAIFGSLTIAGDVLYFGDLAGNLYAVDKASGKAVWRYPLGHRIFATPVVANGVVYAGSDDGVLYALDGPAVPSPRSEVRKVVYWEGPKSKDAFSWFQNGVDTAILNYFKGAGYEQVDAAGLAKLMTGQLTAHGRTVVVFADDKIPADVTGNGDDQALIRRYLNAGGKVAFLGPNPLALQSDAKTGELLKIDYPAGGKVFGVTYLPRTADVGYYGSRVTQDGVRWGLQGFFVSNGGAIDPNQGVTVLAKDEFGMATSWAKNYGGPEGTGLLQLTPPKNELTDLAPYRAAIEHGLY